MIEELLIDIFKKELSSQYSIMGGDAFEKSFCKPTNVNGQFVPQIRYDTFEKNANKIIGVVQAQSAPYAVSDYPAINTTYTLTLWVPVNYEIISSSGELLKTPKFHWESDIEKLRTALNNKTVLFGDYRGELTFSNPVSGGGNYDYSGSYKRKLILINGKINLTQKGYFGRDYIIELGHLDENGEVSYKEIRNRSFINFSPSPTPVENHEQGELVPEENVEAVKPVCVFTIDDTDEDEELNDLFSHLAISGEKTIDKYPIKISKMRHGEKRLYGQYMVYLSATLVMQNGDSDVGVFTISCSRSK